MIGILAEDETDCRTLRVLVRRIIEASGGGEVKVKVKAPLHGGCSTLRKKAAVYLHELGRDGCDAAILVHDLDRDPSVRAKLDAIAWPAPIHKHICIPVEEIEAWFWSDQTVLDLVAKGFGRASLHPHTIANPKEALVRLSRKAPGKASYSTNENEAFARKLDLARCAERCAWFRELQAFVLCVAALWPRGYRRPLRIRPRRRWRPDLRSLRGLV